MSRILLLSGSNSGLEVLTGLIKGNACTDISTAASGAAARRMILAQKYDTVLINAPLADENGDKLSVDIVCGSSASVVLIVNADILGIIASRVEDKGVLVISKPLQKRELFRALHLAEASAARLSALYSENAKLRQKLEEARLCGKVKCLLVERKGMTEADAHRYLEKTAMDKRCSKKELAAEILREFEYED